MKFFVISFLLISSLSSKEFSTRYDVNVGIFGKVGYADVSLIENGNDYEIKLSAITVGTAAVLTGHRVETFISKGKIINGKYVPNTFVKTKTQTRRSRVQNYFFNHEKKEVKLLQEKTKLVSCTEFNPATFEFKTKDVAEKDNEEKIVDDYRPDDVLSSYLNTKDNCKAKERTVELLAFGAYNHKNDVTLTCLEESKKTSVLSRFSNEIKDIYNLHVVPHDKDDTTVDVLVAYDSDGLLKEAILGEVFWIGEITAKRVYHNIKK